MPELVKKFGNEKLVAGSSCVSCGKSVSDSTRNPLCNAEIFHCQYSMHRGPQWDAKSTAGCDELQGPWPSNEKGTGT